MPQLDKYYLHPAAGATASTECLPWHVVDDKSLVCWVKSQNGAPTKTLHSVADLLCSITRERGVTEVRMVDHDLDPKVKVGFCVQKKLDGVGLG